MEPKPLFEKKSKENNPKTLFAENIISTDNLKLVPDYIVKACESMSDKDVVRVYIIVKETDIFDSNKVIYYAKEVQQHYVKIIDAILIKTKNLMDYHLNSCIHELTLLVESISIKHDFFSYFRNLTIHDYMQKFNFIEDKIDILIKEVDIDELSDNINSIDDLLKNNQFNIKQFNLYITAGKIILDNITRPDKIDDYHFATSINRFSIKIIDLEKIQTSLQMNIQQINLIKHNLLMQIDMLDTMLNIQLPLLKTQFSAIINSVMSSNISMSSKISKVIGKNNPFLLTQCEILNFLKR